MCGVIGLSYQKFNKDLGNTACNLLKMLEYRGYDSTGAVIQDNEKVILKKDIGAPSRVSYELGIDKLSGDVFCGQVRWATFGVVTKENAQPHEVKCKTHIYGAHNGNITNCLQLKEWLTSKGHKVVSDNDGEMLVHTVEHFFAEELKFKNIHDHSIRYKALIAAIREAYKKVTGSFAAIIVDPVTKNVAAIKSGSSLYIGQGQDPDSGYFSIASSDLASVLSLTKILVPIKEGEFSIFNGNSFHMFELSTANEIAFHKQRSLLKLEDAKLQHPFKYFMEQEIHSQIRNTRSLISLFTGGDKIVKALIENDSEHGKIYEDIRNNVILLTKITNQSELESKAKDFFCSKSIQNLSELIEKLAIDESLELYSSYSGFLDDLGKLFKTDVQNLSMILKFIDSIFQLENITSIQDKMDKFVNIIGNTRKGNGSIYILACGTSYHAAKTAPLFFNEIAGISVTPLLPGEFRAQCTESLSDNDIVIGISQSGETKDLIDVFNFIERKHPKVRRICILNNVNSTLALEKSELYIPLFCGPEIAVPATKSFLNQLLVIYILAINVRKHLDASSKDVFSSELTAEFHLNELNMIPWLIERTIKTTNQETDAMAEQLYLRPSMHILATRILGIAKEGALKIREIVLNHTEGFEGSEFKHGPNTILGVNTVFGIDAISGAISKIEEILNFVLEKSSSDTLKPRAVLRLYKAITEYALNNKKPFYLSENELDLFEQVFEKYNLFDSMYSNYPLIFLTTPREVDINLTISQINTHKIRGADVFLIAEDNNELREAVSTVPSSKFPYRYGYVTLPKTGSKILPIFSIAVVLQILSLKMSIKKMKYLDSLEVTDHGVHPDVPKNVSKSITVD